MNKALIVGVAGLAAFYLYRQQTIAKAALAKSSTLQPGQQSYATPTSVAGVLGNFVTSLTKGFTPSNAAASNLGGADTTLSTSELNSLKNGGYGVPASWSGGGPDLKTSTPVGLTYTGDPYSADVDSAVNAPVYDLTSMYTLPTDGGSMSV